MQCVRCSRYTIRSALRPDYREQERQRQRGFGKSRAAARKHNPHYIAYQKAYADRDVHRAASRTRMAAMRAAKKDTDNKKNNSGL